VAAIQDVKQYTVKADHSFGSKHKVSGYYYRNGFPRDFSENASEIWSLSDPQTGGPLSRAIHQERRGYNWSVSHDWVVSPTMLNHLQVGENWNGNAFRSINKGLGIADQVGIKGVGLGQPKSEITTPLITLGASPVATFQNFGLDANRDEFYRGVIVSDSHSWQKGAHSLKFGFEYNNLNFSGDYVNNTGGTFNFAARTTAIPGQSYTAQVGNSFASFLLGQVDSASLGPVYGLDTTRFYAAAFVQDSWKVTNRLTLNYGVRWSGNSNYYEANDRIANFNPNLIDPKFGIPGALRSLVGQAIAEELSHITAPVPSRDVLVIRQPQKVLNALLRCRDDLVVALEYVKDPWNRKALYRRDGNTGGLGNVIRQSTNQIAMFVKLTPIQRS
jgi:hypothetical protein